MSSKRFSLIAAASLAALSVAFAIPAASAAAPAAPPVTALVGGTVVGIDGGPALKDATVLIVGERISQIGRADSTPIPPGAKVIPMTGRWLIPGLTNAHVHLGLKLPGPAGDSLALETDTEEVLRMAGNARLSLLSGVTTLRLVGEDHGTDFALRRAIDSGEVVGPRIKTAGEVIIPTGGHGSMEADGPYGFAHVMVREQIKSGADWIKIAISGGISDSHGSISAAPMTDEEMSTLIEVAHRNGIRVTAHNGSNEAARQALRFGIDGFEHGYHLNAEILKDMAKAKGRLAGAHHRGDPASARLRVLSTRSARRPWYPGTRQEHRRRSLGHAAERRQIGRENRARDGSISVRTERRHHRDRRGGGALREGRHDAAAGAAVGNDAGC